MSELALRELEELDTIREQIEETPEIPDPITGELVRLTSPLDVTKAIERARNAVALLDEFKAKLTAVLRLESQLQGTKTLYVGEGLSVTLSGGSKPSVDHELLADLLRQAGLPEKRIEELIYPEVKWKVNRSVERQLRGANPAYAKAIDESTQRVPSPWTVTINRAGASR